ncbi:hypothetical protein FQN54_002389 [Arachnomyces sp. PD_36]|nr:hypothetical protein FQN54_002389 [Arachnomyces sp. PD_36]
MSSSMLSLPSSLPRHLRNPGDDGYRTPTIEDAEIHQRKFAAAATDGFPFPNQRARSLTTADTDGSNPQFRLTVSDSHGEKFRAAGPPTHIDLSDPSWPVKLNWKQRIRHITWAFFTLTMATGGIANVLNNVPFNFRGLETIGVVIFIINIVLYVCIWGLMCLRFYFFPYTFKASFLHPTESLFVPAAAVSFGTILINISQFGPEKTGTWLNDAIGVLFWFQATLAVVFSAGIYLLLWSTQTFTIAQMTPVWIFPAYTMLIIGPHAGIISSTATPETGLRVVVGGTTIQGVGFLVSMMVYSAFIYRLMTQKLPKENLRPGMFVSVGPSAFTAAGLITMAANAENVFPKDFMGNGELAAMIIKVVANFTGLWLWGLAIFFFLIATFAHVSVVGNDGFIFSMTWYSFVFPNTALITSTFAIGKAFACKPIQILGCVMTVLLIIIYIFVTYMMIRAVRLHHILWPQKGEDKDEGGFKIKEIKPETPRVDVE